MIFRVTRKYGMYEPGDLLVATPSRIKEVTFAGFAVAENEAKQPSEAPAKSRGKE